MTLPSASTAQALLAVTFCLMAGCGAKGWRESPGPVLPELPIESAVRLVNENTAKITATVRGVGNVDGQFADERGRRTSFHADGTIFYLPPRNLRFDIKKLGNREFLFGSNEQMYWVYTRRDDRFMCHSHGSADQDAPIHPDRLPDALGLRTVSLTPGKSQQVFQRVTGDAQVLRFRGSDAADDIFEREYWLDRRAPRLIKRVIYRNARGQVILESRLGDYAALETGGAFLPRQIEARWPAQQNWMRFTISRWTVLPDVVASSPQFATPEECLPPAESN